MTALAPLVLLLPLYGTGAEPSQSEPTLEWQFWYTPNQCAAWTVFHAMALCQGHASVPEIDRLLPADGKPKSLLDIRAALEALGICARAQRLDTSSLSNRPRAMIVPLKREGAEHLHFLLVAGWDDEKAIVLDGTRPVLRIEKPNLAAALGEIGLVLGERDRPARLVAILSCLGGFALGSGLTLLAGRKMALRGLGRIDRQPSGVSAKA